MRAFSSDDAELPLPERHPFPITKYRLLRERVTAARLAEVEDAPAASDAELCLTHDPAYVAAVASGLLDSAMMRRIGFPWSPELVERSRRSVGATIAAARACLRDGIAVSLAGGTHHARFDAGAGYCVFNDVVVAARLLRREDRLRRVVVLDCDVHQGDGTASLLAGDPEAFTLSIHGANNYPARKVPGDLDAALPDGTGDDAYLKVLAPAVVAALERSEAEIAFYLAGADPFVGDRWGRLALTKAGLASRDRAVLDACRRRGVPVVVLMAGGYAPAVDDIVDIHEATVRAAAAEALRAPEVE